MADAPASVKLISKDMNRPDIIEAKKTELKKFYSFNVVQKVNYAPQGCIAIHVDDALTASNEKFYSRVITPLLSQLCISKVERALLNFWA